MGYHLRDTSARQQRAAAASGQFSSSSSMVVDTPPKPLTQECTICRDDKPPTSFPSSPPTSRCTHKPTICTTCLARHIEAEVNDKSNATHIRCPIVNCRVEMQHHEIQALATPPVFHQFDQLLLKKALRELPDFRWCKRATCGSGQDHIGGRKYPIMTCAACHFRSCFTHDVPWHSGLTCTEFEETLDTERNRATRAYLDRRTKPCPRCGRSIEKNGGCDHMTCRRPGGCGYEFCWLCLAPYERILRRGNHIHRTTCQYYYPYQAGEDGEDDDEFDEGEEGDEGDEDQSDGAGEGEFDNDYGDEDQVEDEDEFGDEDGEQEAMADDSDIEYEE
ncbi:hypothetical protein HK102_007986 [Quaeritorhiza haematococci]|nr:hypothetical protein HK102_007986 [Quaeritorhiza haematococci]